MYLFSVPSLDRYFYFSSLHPPKKPKRPTRYPGPFPCVALTDLIPTLPEDATFEGQGSDAKGILCYTSTETQRQQIDLAPPILPQPPAEAPNLIEQFCKALTFSLLTTGITKGVLKL